MPGFNHSSFQVPRGTPEQQLAHCVRIIQAQRKELLPIREKLNTSKLRETFWEKTARHWREKHQQAEEELKKLKEKNKLLEEEKDRLKKEIEKISKTNNRYQVSLFDHGNFKHKEEGLEKKEKGGQAGHADTNREKEEDYSSYQKKRIFAKTCGKCNSPLSRVLSTKQKILLDIVINPEIVRMIILSERQWCSKCQKAVIAKDPQTLPFTEYGINIFMMVAILRFSVHSSFANISKVLLAGYGLEFSKSDASNLLKAASRYLGKQYEELKQEIRDGEVMYNDETGWTVHGQKAWMWIMANEKETVYVAAESRGKGIAEEIYGNSKAHAMTDGLLSYFNTIPKDKHLYCWAHVLRFAFEETIHSPKEHQAINIRNRLVDLYQTIRFHKEWTKDQKKKELRKELDNILSVTSDDQTVKNIQYRVATQKEGLILALLITKDGTNNLGERELRNMAIKRTVSHGSDTYKGMETTAIIGSVMQTLSRDKERKLLPTLQTYLKEGVQERYSQYIHIPYYDS